MAIEDSLKEVADSLTYCPVSLIQHALDCAPALYDRDSGRLSPIIDLDSKDFAMTRGEARTLVDMCGEFAIAGFASDGSGNGVPVPMAVYEERPSFKEKHPRLYKALRIGGVILAVGSLVGLAGCIGSSPDREGEIHEKIYHEGEDKNSTLDDKIVFTLAYGGNWYWISTTSSKSDIGVNVTKVNESMETGSGIAFDYDQYTGDPNSEKVPYRVTKVYWINNESTYRPILDKREHDKQIDDEKNNKIWIAVGLGTLTVLSGVITLALSTGIPEYMSEQRRKRRIKNR
ncbi:MAG: hypothetical protein HY438_00670 [DPANN group archaeon]|nr:hypothetical protein [DPANN group archaeon]